jgi:hypothetical protein
VPASLESAIDALYQEPLGSFTSARNALAKTLRGADATRVKQLKKPTVVPWAVNQLYWKSRHTFERLLKSGKALRAAQIGALQGSRGAASAADIRKAADAHRAALADAVDEAARLARQADASPDPEPLSRMLEAVSLAADRPEHPGRFTEALRPAGFEALAGLQPAARPARETPPEQDAGPSARNGAAPARDRGAERRAREEERRVREQERTAQREAARRAAKQQTLDAAVEKAQTDVARAKKTLAAAEHALAAARARAEQHRRP